MRCSDGCLILMLPFRVQHNNKLRMACFTGAWEDGVENTTSKVDYKALGRFLYLEGMEYLMYNTVDVHFLASFGLLW